MREFFLNDSLFLKEKKNSLKKGINHEREKNFSFFNNIKKKKY